MNKSDIAEAFRLWRDDYDRPDYSNRELYGDQMADAFLLYLAEAEAQ